MQEFLTAEMLNLPQVLFDTFKNVVVTTKHTGGFTIKSTNTKKPAALLALESKAYKEALALSRKNGTPRPTPVSQYYYVHKFTPTSKDEQYGMLLLNYIYDLIHSFKYTYEGEIDGKHTFHKFHGDFLAADKNVYKDYDSWVKISKGADDKWFIEKTNELPVLMFPVPDEANKTQIGPNTFLIPNKAQAFTYEQIAFSIGWTVEQTIAHDFDYEFGEEKDPSKYLTSMFPVWASDGNDFTTYISGQRYDLIDFKLLLAENGKKYADYDINMAALNDCSIPVDHKDADSTGNFGECADAWYETEEEAKAFTFDYDLNKAFAVKQFAIEVSSPNGMPNGHYPRYVAWFDLKNNKVVHSPSEV